MKRIVFLLVLSMALLSGVVATSQAEDLLCGVAIGYPPYQYQNKSGKVAGMDVEIAQSIVARMGREIVFRQEAWDTIVTSLRLERLDFISGMEINAKRRQMFDFTSSYYIRKIGIFVLANDKSIESIYDLKWKVIAGDRHSYVEHLFEKLKLTNQIRIHQTKSKDESMVLLIKGDVVALVAPVEVAYHLAHKYGVRLRVLEDSDPGSQVGIAVHKGNYWLLSELELALDMMKKDGSLEMIIRKWRQ